MLAGLLPGTASALPLVGNAQTVVREVRGFLEAEERTIYVDSDVFQNEEIVTGPNSATRIIFKDGTNLEMGENSRLRLTKLVFDPDPNKSKVAVKALVGVFRWTSGKLPHEAYSIATPVATIGIRGTTLEFIVFDNRETTVALSRGLIVVSNLKGDSVTLHPGEATTIEPPDADGDQAPPSAIGKLPAKLQDMLWKMTVMVRLADPPADVVPEAGGDVGAGSGLALLAGSGPAGGSGFLPVIVGGTGGPADTPPPPPPNLSTLLPGTQQSPQFFFAPSPNNGGTNPGSGTPGNGNNGGGNVPGNTPTGNAPSGTGNQPADTGGNQQPGQPTRTVVGKLDFGIVPEGEKRRLSVLMRLPQGGAVTLVSETIESDPGHVFAFIRPVAADAEGGDSLVGFVDFLPLPGDAGPFDALLVLTDSLKNDYVFDLAGTVEETAIPEPAALLVFMTGLVALIALRRRRRA